MTVRSILFSIFYTLACGATAQISDDFSDGDLRINPAWKGDLNQFVHTADGKLRLDVTGADTSAIVVQGNIQNNSAWSLDVRLDFAPSPQNRLRIYLLADQPDLWTANGYYLEIGETGNADALRMFRQNGSVRTSIAVGTAGTVATAPVDITIKMRRTEPGLWSADIVAGAQTFPQFEVTDTVFGGGCNRFFGIQCFNTTTNKDKFSFDNLQVSTTNADVVPPKLLSAKANTSTQITLLFNKVLDSLSATRTTSYTLDNGIGNPQRAVLLPDRKSVQLQLAQPLPNGQFRLQAERISDCYGNVSGTQFIDFQYFNIDDPSEFDIIINEIFADVSPTAGLPEAEWIELYNRSKKFINLSDMTLSDGSGSPKTLPSVILPPDSFVVLCTPANAPVLRAVTHRVAGVTGFPSLNDAGDLLTLSDADNNIIDRVPFLVGWHTDKSKDDGGWSLERIDPDKPCLGAVNWQSCPYKPGGTPGTTNASLQRTPDTEPPHIVSVFPLDDRTLRLIFSEGLQRAGVSVPTSYTIVPALNVSSATRTSGYPSIAVLTLATPLARSTLYRIIIGQGVQDCSGNPARRDTLAFGLPEVPAPLDVVINEVMFNPATRGAEYVEVYNRSTKTFSWEHFFIANFYDNTDIERVGREHLLLPGDYAVLTNNADDLLQRFSPIFSEKIIEMAMPSFGDKEGNVTLYWSKDGKTVTTDSLTYSDSWHNGLLNTGQREGVALERITTEEATNLPANWTSASSNKTGNPGTPTLPNSQRRIDRANSADDMIRLPVARLSPDADGFEDFLEIQYQVPDPGFAATITIFDSGGIPVRRIGRQELVGTEGFLRWDGEVNNGTRARPGIYILFAEFFDSAGTVYRAKKAFSVVYR